MIKELTLRKSVFWSILEITRLSGLLGLKSEPGNPTTGALGSWVEIVGYGCLHVQLYLDFIGDTCLRTNLLTKRALAETVDGDVIEIVTDNLSSVETIPFMLPNYNGMHLATCQDAKHWRIYIQKHVAANHEREETGNESGKE